MFKFLLFLCFGSWSRTHHCTPMLGILEDAPYVCLLYMGTVGIRKAQKSSRDVFHSGSQKTRLPLSIGSLRVTWCPRPMEDNGADPEAVASVPSAGAAGDPTPPSRCSSRELCGSRWFLPSLHFKIVLGAWKVSINFPHGLLVGWGGPGLVRAALAVLLSGSAASVELSPRAMGLHGWLENVPGLCLPLVTRGDFSTFLWEGRTWGRLWPGLGSAQGDAGALRLQCHGRWVWSRSASSWPAFPGVSLGGSLGIPKLRLLQLPLGPSPTTWHPSPSWRPSLLEGTPTFCCAITEASAQDPADVAVPGPASGADCGRGSEGAQAWLPTPATGFHFHAAQKAFPPPLGPNLSLKQYFFSPSSHQFHNVSVQPKPVSSLCSIQPWPLKDPLVAPCGVDLPQRLGGAGTCPGFTRPGRSRLLFSLVKQCFAFGNYIFVALWCWVAILISQLCGVYGNLRARCKWTSLTCLIIL